jgi:hypothetical protein
MFERSNKSNVFANGWAILATPEVLNLSNPGCKPGRSAAISVEPGTGSTCDNAALASLRH